MQCESYRTGVFTIEIVRSSRNSSLKRNSWVVNFRRRTLREVIDNRDTSSVEYSASARLNWANVDSGQTLSAKLVNWRTHGLTTVFAVSALASGTHSISRNWTRPVDSGRGSLLPARLNQTDYGIQSASQFDRRDLSTRCYSRGWHVVGGNGRGLGDATVGCSETSAY